MAGVALASLPQGIFWYIASTGELAPAAGATAHIYEHGTTTQVQVYSDEALTHAINQPLTTQADGSLPGYISVPVTGEIGHLIDVVGTFEGVTLDPVMSNAIRADTAMSGGGGGGVTIPLILDSSAATSPVLETGVTGNAHPNMITHADGSLHWNYDGSAPPTLQLVLDNLDALGVYPENSQAFGSVLNLYGGDWLPDGSGSSGGLAAVGVQSGLNSFVELSGDLGAPAGGEHVSVRAVVVGAPATGEGTPTSMVGLRQANGTNEYLAILQLNADHNLNTAGQLVLTADGPWASNAPYPWAINITTSGVRGFTIGYDGAIEWGGQLGTRLTGDDGSGSIKLTKPGGGLKLISPDGATTKTISIDNTGALVVA